MSLQKIVLFSQHVHVVNDGITLQVRWVKKGGGNPWKSDRVRVV